MDVVIRPEMPADLDAILEVTRIAFGGSSQEPLLVMVLRDGGFARLSLVAEKEDLIVGHILFSELQIVAEGGTTAALALAPMSVLPEHQRTGIGSALVRRGLELCREAGHRIVIVLGHPHYYRRFGFSPVLARPLESPFSNSGDAWMALELLPGALQGVTGNVQYPPPFLALG